MWSSVDFAGVVWFFLGGLLYVFGSLASHTWPNARPRITTNPTFPYQHAAKPTKTQADHGKCTKNQKIGSIGYTHSPHTYTTQEEKKKKSSSWDQTAASTTIRQTPFWQPKNHNRIFRLLKGHGIFWNS